MPAKTEPAEAGPPTQPLTPAPFTPLPAGAFINNGAGEYRVEQIQSAKESLNLYDVVDVRGVRACPVCGYLGNLSDENYCRHCGGDLSDVPVSHLYYVAQERANGAGFGIARRLAGLDLSEPALRLPRTYFQKRVGGAERHYLITSPAPPQWLDAVQPPQEAPQVLEWGLALSMGLGALHQQDVAFGPISGDRIALEGERVRLADFGACSVPGREEQYRQEVHQLATLLFYLLTGVRQYTADNGLPVPVDALFSRALTPDPSFTTAAAFAGAIEEVLAEIRRPASLDFRVGRRTDVGVQRQLNEDSMLTLTLVWNNQSASRPVGVYVVADGMGGHTAGEVASGLALQAIAKTATRDLLVPTTDGNGTVPDYEAWVRSAVQAANEAVHARVQKMGNDMGTTLVIALIVEETAYIGHVGDSRAYLVNAGDIEQVTVDHSLMERLIATGQVTREEARHHPQRSVIYRTIGDKPKVEVDTTHVRLKPGDRLLLCSDGLNGMVEDEEIHRLTMTAGSPQAACNRLIRAANNAGGEDNTTVIIVQAEEVQ